MSLYPHAIHRLMPYNDDLPHRQAAHTAIFHTNGGGTDNGSLYNWFARKGNNICSHFQIMWDGTTEQYVDTNHEAYAQYAANAYGISLEFQDDGNPSKPFTKAQIDSAVGICRWAAVPARISPDGSGGGVGWHSLYDDWNQSHHNCPGSVRIDQIRKSVIPALGQPQPAPARVPSWWWRNIRFIPGKGKTMGGHDVLTVRGKLKMSARPGHYYDEGVARRVEDFQRAHHLGVDGIVGPQTATAFGE